MLHNAVALSRTPDMSRVDPALRVAHIHWAMPPTTGGTESHVAELARWLSADAEVTVVTGESKPLEIPGCAIETSPLLNLEYLRDPARDLTQLRSALLQFFSSLLRHYDWNVVHGHNLHHFFAEPALALDHLRKEHDLALFHTFHETWPDILTDQPVYRGWSANYAISRHVQEECENRLGFRPELMLNAVDVSRFRATTVPFDRADAVTILHPARLLPWKGVDQSVEMLRMLHDDGIAAQLILTDTQRIVDWDDQLIDYADYLRRLIDESGLSDYVRFVRVSQFDMPALYAECDIVVYPTIGEEPFGLVPIEAMSCRRPVVVSRSGGIPESVIDGVTGWIVERRDLNAYAERVAWLIGNPERAVAMGEAGRRHVVANHDMESYTVRLMRNYSRAVTNPTPP